MTVLPHDRPSRAADMDGEELQMAVLVRSLRRTTGLDLSCYRKEHIRRRITAVMTKTGTRSPLELARMLENNPARAQEIRDELTINVSEFFRDKERFRFLEERVLPEIIRENRKPVLWSAGCSIGAEPYSLAMIMKDLMPGGRFRIVATDVDRRTLEIARAGNSFSAADLRNVSPERMARYVRPENKRYAVVDSIRRAVEFRYQNLLTDNFEPGLDLIACRNVIIYFTAAAKDALFIRMAMALREGGVLFLGATENLPHTMSAYFASMACGFYRRTSREVKG